MKKLMWVFLFLLFLGMPMNTHAEVLVQRDKSVYYYYDDKNTERSIPLFHNYETNMPIFMINFKGDPRGFEMEEIDASELPYDEEEIEWIKDVITILMNGRSYPEADLNTYLGIQVLLWKMWSEKKNEPIRYSFLTNFALVEDKKKVEELRGSFYEPIHYSYQGKVNEKIKTSFVPNFLDEYTLKPVGDAPKVEKDGNTFWFTAEEPGDYEYLVDSAYFDEQLHFYKEDDMYFVELSKPKEKPVYLDYHIEDEEKHFEAHILPSEGITSQMKDTYEEGKTVTISYDLDDDYEVLGISAYTASGKSIEIENDSFIMPSENVLIQIQTRKISTYNIFVSNQEGVSFDIEKYVKARETVEIHYTLEKHYHLKNLKVTTMSGQELPVKNNTFIMPSENVILSYDLEKDPDPEFYEVYLVENIGGHINLEKKKYLIGEKVNFTYDVEAGYQLDSIEVKTVSGREIPVSSSSFQMPNENIIIQIRTSKIPFFSIFVSQQEGVTFEIKNQAKASEIIEIHYTLKEHYHLKNLKVTTMSGQEIPVKNNAFIMPSEDVILSYEIEKDPEPKLYEVYVQYDMGSTLVLEKNAYLEGETVDFTYTIESGYLLDEIIAKTLDGKILPINSHSFIMPDASVILTVKASPVPEVPSYPIFIPQTNGIHFEKIGEYQEGEKVSLKYFVEETYELMSLKVYSVNGEEIHIESNTFIMPNSPVIILSELKIIPSFRIFLMPNEHIEASTSKNSYKTGENVTLSYEVEDGYLLDQVHVYTISGVEVTLENLTFSMPSDDVVVEFISKEKIDATTNLEEQLPKEEVKTYSIPNTKKNSLVSFLLLSLLIAFFLLKIYA